MSWCVYGVGSLVASIMILAVVGCQQENPVEKIGTEITEHTQGTIDKAKEVGREGAGSDDSTEVEVAGDEFGIATGSLSAASK